MSQRAQGLMDRQMAEVHVRQAIIMLDTAGACLLRARQFLHDEQAHALTSALRDDITAMVGDASALLSVIRQA